MLEITETENSPGPRIASPDGSTVPIARGAVQVFPPSADSISQSTSRLPLGLAPQQRWSTIRIAPVRVQQDLRAREVVVRQA